MALVKKSRAEVFEKRKSIVMAIFKQDAAERSRRIVAMKDKSCNLSVACVSLLSRWHAQKILRHPGDFGLAKIPANPARYAKGVSRHGPWCLVYMYV